MGIFLKAGMCLIGPVFHYISVEGSFRKKKKFTQETHGFKSTIIRIERRGVREGREGGEGVGQGIVKGIGTGRERKEKEWVG